MAIIWVSLKLKMCYIGCYWMLLAATTEENSGVLLAYLHLESKGVFGVVLLFLLLLLQLTFFCSSISLMLHLFDLAYAIIRLVILQLAF